MHNPVPLWFTCCVCAVLMALLICLLLFPVTAQPNTIRIEPLTFHL